MNRIPPSTNSKKTIQILVVEDEKIIALNLKENLESLGYSVVALAASGEQAVEKAIEFHPNLVLMDIRIKGNVDGIEAAERIWEYLSIPVIYVTGHSDRSTLKRAKITAPFGYILKPVKVRELAVAIEIALQRYEREQLLNAILREMGDGVIVVDKQCRVQSLNRMAESLTGWQLCAAKEQELTRIWNIINEQTQQPVDIPVTAALQNDTLVYLQDSIVLISENGTAIPIEGSIAPIKDNHGAIAGAVLVFRDISDAVAAATQRKRAELAIREQLEKERRLNQLQTHILHTISHEYRTPLSTILACSQLLESQNRPPSVEKLHRNCQKIQRSVKYMVRLLEDIQTFNQAESGELTFNPTPLDLNQFCAQLIKEYRLIDSNQHKIQLISRGKSHTACVDSKLLQQILGNLLSNALKYSPVGSAIALVMTYENHQIIFHVKDKGIGISREDRLHIFEPFHRGKNVGVIRGMGMGLAIVKRALNLHGGNICVESEAGVGTTFTVTLPVSTP
ncbi:MAG TPA: ATP-binding protein [Coleofasciculaceae cyanobacterium]